MSMLYVECFIKILFSGGVVIIELLVDILK